MAIAIVKDDKVVSPKGYGARELGKPDKVDENTVFAIASNSKAFTTASLAMLVDEKKLSWDDKVSKYLPDFQLYDPWVTSELTIRDLVTHRVGLDTFSGDLLWYETTYPADEILRRVRYLPRFSSFRTRFGYQNLMFIAAGKVIEKVSGRSWCDFVTERIYAASYEPHDVQRQQPARRCRVAAQCVGRDASPSASGQCRWSVPSRGAKFVRGRPFEMGQNSARRRQIRGQAAVQRGSGVAAASTISRTAGFAAGLAQ
jgi:CubicO group peptidase (beta-lactamase class C family)